MAQARNEDCSTALISSLMSAPVTAALHGMVIESF